MFEKIMHYIEPALKAQLFPIIICILGFFAIFFLLKRIKPVDQITKVYRKINGHLVEKKEKKGGFNYDKILLFLKKSGLLYKYPSLGTPIVFISVKILLGLLLGTLLMSLSFPAFIAGFLLGYKALDIYARLYNQSYNHNVNTDIQIIYNSLLIQISSGVYPLTALAECYDLVDDPRLQLALMEFSVGLQNHNSSNNLIKEFQNSFDNKYIDSLCLILEQGLQSGKFIGIIEDVSNQIKSSSMLRLQQKRLSMDRSMTLTILILFSDVISVIIYLAINGISSNLVRF